MKFSIIVTVPWRYTTRLFLIMYWKQSERKGLYIILVNFRGAGKSLARPTSQCILFDGENISFDASLVLCIYK